MHLIAYISIKYMNNITYPWVKQNVCQEYKQSLEYTKECK